MSRKPLKAILILILFIIFIAGICFISRYVHQNLEVTSYSHINTDNWTTVFTDAKFISKTIQVTNYKENEESILVRIIDTQEKEISPQQIIKAGESKIILDKLAVFKKPYIVQVKAIDTNGEYNLNINSYIKKVSKKVN